MTRTSLHLGYGEKPPEAHVATYPTHSPIARVEIDGGAITIQASDPGALLIIADAFQQAATLLADELGVDAAKAVDAQAVSV